jgi:hypothetical protein
VDLGSLPRSRTPNAARPGPEKIMDPKSQEEARRSADIAAKQAQYPFHKRFVRKPVQIRVEVERFQEGLASSSVNISPSGICFEIAQSSPSRSRTGSASACCSTSRAARRSRS